MDSFFAVEQGDEPFEKGKEEDPVEEEEEYPQQVSDAPKIVFGLLEGVVHAHKEGKDQGNVGES